MAERSASPAAELAHCRICGSADLGDSVTAREMMFGSREAFAYVPCQACGTLQIARFPQDMARHYPSSYYSYNDARRRSWLKRALLRAAARYMVGRPERAPAGTGRFARIKRTAEPWIAHVRGLRRDSSILDIGCGEGARLEALASLGFSDLTGVDPFMPAARAGRTRSGALLLRMSADAVDRQFDLVTMHHSLEHVEDPAGLLAAARTRLAAGGRVLVRVPLLQSWLWERFGTSWAQLDPPRHVHLFTPRALIGLAERCGLRCDANGFDGEGWSIGWSEAFARDIPMLEGIGALFRQPFSDAELAQFDAEAERRNRAGEGESGWFVLSPAQGNDVRQPLPTATSRG